MIRLAAPPPAPAIIAIGNKEPPPVVDSPLGAAVVTNTLLDEACRFVIGRLGSLVMTGTKVVVVVEEVVEVVDELVEDVVVKLEVVEVLDALEVLDVVELVDDVVVVIAAVKYIWYS